MSSTYALSRGPLRLSHPRPSRPSDHPQHESKTQPNPISTMFLVDDGQPDPTEATPSKGAKVTQRMLQLRELIEQGSYPDKDELAERIVDKL